MYSEGRVPSLDLIKGLIETAKLFSPHFFDIMIGFPFEVPAGWFFIKCLFAFWKLSGVSLPPHPAPRHILLSLFLMSIRCLRRHRRRCACEWCCYHHPQTSISWRHSKA
jgi:hypothetical protein